MIRVNLLATKPGAKRQHEWLPAAQRHAAAGLGLLMLTGIGVGGWWFLMHSQLQAAEGAIVKSEASLVRLKDAARLVDQANARKAELTERLTLIDRLRSTKRGPVNLLETVSKSAPEGLWLLEINQKGPTVQIEGRSTSLTSLTDFVEHMQDSGLFDRPVEIMTTGTETVDEVSLVRFNIKAQAAGTAAANAAAAAAAEAAKKKKAN